MNNKKEFAFSRINFILLAIGMAVVIIGFILMSGPGSTDTEFNPAIFDARHVKVAPLVCLIGYLFIIYAIVKKPADKKPELPPLPEADTKPEAAEM